MLTPDWSTILAAGTVVGSAGAAWGAVKMSLNGTRERVIEHAKELKEHVKNDAEVQTVIVDRLARIETKLDVIMDKRV